MSNPTRKEFSYLEVAISNFFDVNPKNLFTQYNLETSYLEDQIAELAFDINDGSEELQIRFFDDNTFQFTCVSPQGKYSSPRKPNPKNGLSSLTVEAGLWSQMAVWTIDQTANLV